MEAFENDSCLQRIAADVPKRSRFDASGVNQEEFSAANLNHWLGGLESLYLRFNPRKKTSLEIAARWGITPAKKRTLQRFFEKLELRYTATRCESLLGD